MSRLPDFLIIGAMKCATSTVHDWLDQQTGFFMTNPKEPCFFSDDHVFAKGEEWYRSLFDGASEQHLCGESSTHYTKLPTYPEAVQRLRAIAPDIRLVYVMRHPVDRLVSQYIHEWTENRISVGIEQAVDDHSELIDYSLYGMQIAPYLESWGPGRILPVFFEKLVRSPREELERVARFVGHRGALEWSDELGASNVSRERLRKSPLRDLVVNAPVVSTIRKHLVPKATREWVKGFWRMKKRPTLSNATKQRLRERFDEDLGDLSSWLGFDLTCAGFEDLAAGREVARAEDER